MRSYLRNHAAMLAQLCNIRSSVAACSKLAFNMVSSGMFIACTAAAMPKLSQIQTSRTVRLCRKRRAPQPHAARDLQFASPVTASVTN